MHQCLVNNYQDVRDEEEVGRKMAWGYTWAQSCLRAEFETGLHFSSAGGKVPETSENEGKPLLCPLQTGISLYAQVRLCILEKWVLRC